MGRIITASHRPETLFGYGGKKFFRQSGVFVSPLTGLIRVMCIGGGGGGASGSSGGSNPFMARGGGGGGFALKEIYVKRGDSFVVTIGNGGNGGSGSSDIDRRGKPGGFSSFGQVVSATGGKGGDAANMGEFTQEFLGGTGQGGDINFAGGNGGRFVGNNGQPLPGNSAIFNSATGGGAAASLYGDGGSGGDFILKVGNGSAELCATGGGGVGMSDAEPINIESANVTGKTSNGAGTAGLGVEGRFFTAGHTSFLQPGSDGLSRFLLSPIYPMDGKGGSVGGTSGLPGAGGGGRGGIMQSTTPPENILALLCGGGGGVAGAKGASGQSVRAGGGGFFGGGGGAVSAFGTSFNQSNQNGGNGSSGIVIIEW